MEDGSHGYTEASAGGSPDHLINPIPPNLYEKADLCKVNKLRQP